MMALAQAGADRQEMHEHLEKLSLIAWQILINTLDWLNRTRKILPLFSASS
jgi:hypothetical protein